MVNNSQYGDLTEGGITVAASVVETPAAPTGRRGAMRSLGAAAMALLAAQSLTGSAGAKHQVKRQAKKVKPGIGAITQVEDNQTVQPGQWNEGFAQCPPGLRVIAGGGYLDNDLCVLTGSQQATVLPETWFAGGRCPAGQTSNIRVTALCVA